MKKIYLVVLCVALNFFASLAMSAESDSKPAAPAPAIKEEPKEDKLGVFDFITNIPSDYVETAHTVFSKSSIAPFAVVAATTGVGIAYDYELWRPTHDHYQEAEGFHHWMKMGAQLGVGGSQIILGGVFVGAGLVTSNHKALRTGSQITEAVIATGITTQFLKHIVGRESPNCATEPRTGKWQWFTSPHNYHQRVSAHDAFPSGHIATAFATATVVAENYPDQAWIPYVSYPIVGLIGFGMVATDGHWFSDYPLSIFLGYHFGRAVTRNNPERKAKEDPKAIAFDFYMPFAGARGIQLTKAF